MAVQQSTSGDFILLKQHIKSYIVFILIHCLSVHILTLQVSRYQSNSLCFIWYHLHLTDCIHGKLKSPFTRAVHKCYVSKWSIPAMNSKICDCLLDQDSHNPVRPKSCNWYITRSILSGLWLLIPRTKNHAITVRHSQEPNDPHLQLLNKGGSLFILGD